MTRQDKAELNIELLAWPVEYMRSTGFLLFAATRIAVGEVAAIVDQQLGDLNGTGLLDLGQEADTAGIKLVGTDLDEDPTRGAVDGNE